MTIYDIAKEAGVSIATVSRVLSGKDNVSQKTRQRVEAVMVKHDYAPSIIARGMSSKSLKTVAIMALHFQEIHHMRIAHEIESHFSQLDYNVIMYDTGTDLKNILRFFQRMRERAIDGIIFIGSAFQLLRDHPDEVKNIMDEIPVVIANGWVEGAYGILVDEGYGMRQVVDHLIGQGRGRLVYLKSSSTDSAQRKLTGFQSRIQEYGRDGSATIIRTTHDLQDNLKLMERIIGEYPDCQAIIADEDITGVMAIKGLSRLGVRIPHDIAVTGYNNSEYAILSIPGMTSVDNLAGTQGELCAELLTKLMTFGKAADEEKKPTFMDLKPKLIIRASSCPTLND